MKRQPNRIAGRVLLVALALIVMAATALPSAARQSERTRSRTQSSRVERRATPRAKKQAPRVDRRVEEKARPAQRADRSRATQRQNTERPQRNSAPAQRAPSRVERNTPSTQRAPARSGRATRQDPPRIQSAPRAGRGTAVAPRGSSARPVDRTPNLRSRRNGSVVQGNRSALRRPWRPAVRDRVLVVPRYRYHPVRYHYSRPFLRARWPHIHVHLDWPWLVRYERRWAPRYRYRQVIRVEVVQNGRRDWSNVEVETYYRHTVRRATADWAEIDIEIDQIDVYDGDYYLGYVDRLPADLRTIRATVYRDGEIRFDREVFLVGDPTVGFEVISTRHYDGWVQDSYRPEDGYRAGRVDLRRHRVESIRRSRLWDPYRYTGVVPVSLLPDQEGWLWDYGVEALSAAYDDYGVYYGGTEYVAPRGPSEDPGLLGADEWSYRTRDGADIRLERASNLERVR